MKHPFAEPIRYRLRGSAGLTAWLAAVYGGAVAAAWGSSLPAGAAALLSVFAAAGFIRGLRLHALRTGRDAVVWLEIGVEVRVGLAGGQVCPVRPRPFSFVHPWIIVLRLESEGGPRCVLVPRDSLSAPAEHKVLRRRLRHGEAR